MHPLDHAAAHERLADLALEPGGVASLGDPALDPLAAHLATCEICRRDVAAWRRTHARLVEAMGGADDRIELRSLASDEPIAAPSAIRSQVLAAARSERRAVSAPAVVVAPPGAAMPVRGPGRLRLRRPAPTRWLSLAAVLAVLVVGAGVLLDRQTRLDAAARDVALLEGVAATADRVLRDPNHHVLDLRGADGIVHGSLSWSSHDLVVLTTALEPPPSGREYRCWIERDGARSPVGKMWFAGDTAFWTGSLDEWAETSFAGGGTFGVSLEPIDGPGGHPAVLVADLGS